MPLIDISTLWKCETCFFDHYGKCTNKCGCDHGESYRPAYSKLKVVDAVPVLRCKDCKHWTCFMNNPDGTLFGNCECYSNDFRDEDDFCSYGERVETAENSKKLESHSKG